MPVNNDVKPVLNCGLDDPLNAVNIGVRVFEIIPIALCAHSDADDACVPIFGETFHCAFGVKAFLSPTRIGPEKTWPSEGGDCAVCVNDMRPRDRELPMPLNRSLRRVFSAGCLGAGTGGAGTKKYCQDSGDEKKSQNTHAATPLKFGPNCPALS